MFRFLKKWKKTEKREMQAEMQPEEARLETSLDANVQTLRRIFEDVDILNFRFLRNRRDENRRFCLIYNEGMVDKAAISKGAIHPLMEAEFSQDGEDYAQILIEQVLKVDVAKPLCEMDEILKAIGYGDAILLAEGLGKAIMLRVKKMENRAITEPENERSLVGPRDGFTETLMVNLSMLRRRIASPDFKIKFRTLGERTHTRMCVCYVDGIVNKQILAELYRRLDAIEIDAILDTNYIAELIMDAPWSPFATTGYTERPDVAVGKLMEGRIAILIEGSPMVLTVPFLFIENFQSGEDYYVSFLYASFSRVIRMMGFFLTIIVPSMYIAVSAFHHEMFPLPLFISVAAEQQSVPLPTAMEALAMIVLFDILKETGARMPTTIGQALSIVGALVIGQAAVDAKLVAAPMIIVVALTGITALLVPKLSSPMIFLRFLLLILSSTFGFFGMMLGLSGILIHLLNLQSFGVPHLMTSRNLQYQNVKDIVIRAPWWQMIGRPVFSKNRVRQRGRGRARE